MEMASLVFILFLRKSNIHVKFLRIEQVYDQLISVTFSLPHSILIISAFKNQLSINP